MNIEHVNSIEDAQPALIYIPDMSGFTEFIYNTKIQYSKKLIHHLLEVIIDSNILNLKVAEIQGDAILFYKTGVPPSATKLEAQAKKTFRDFQLALEKLEKEDLLLKGAANLTLKIIVHYGCISTTNIKGITKLVGLDLIIAHRILKNNVRGKEYLLMTDNYIKSQNEAILSKSFRWSELKPGKKSYPHIGSIHYHYVSLTPLRKAFKIRPLQETSREKVLET